MTKEKTHINVTIDFSKKQKEKYDLRIPVHQPIQKLLVNLVETLDLDIQESSLFAVKVPAKGILLADDDRLSDYPVASGDILLVL